MGCVAVFSIITTGFAVYSYVWEFLKNGDWSVKFSFRGAYIAFAAVGLLIIILTCALKIDTSEYFLPRIVIFGITAAAIGGLFAIGNLVNYELGYLKIFLPLVFLILLANLIAVPVVVFKKYASPTEWLVCVTTNPFLMVFVCGLMTLVIWHSCAETGYYAFL